MPKDFWDLLGVCMEEVRQVQHAFPNDPMLPLVAHQRGLIKYYAPRGLLLENRTDE